jgi:threonylcarbamoyladenosine tRNA methylthiotransferase MtaB
MIPYQRAAFYTLGCKLNFAETSTLARALQEEGYARVSFDERADIYVINTCSVTENADKECKQVVKKALKQNPLALVVVTGCYAQLKPQEVANIAGVDLVLGANEKFDIASQVAQLQHKKAHAQVQVQAIKEARHFHASYSMGDRTRTFLKVQDGCDYFCAFCTIPLARGRSRSASIADTLEKAKIAIAEGAKEIVLTGVNLGDFGSGTDENFLQLIQALDVLAGDVRFRISSIEPNLLTDAVIDFVAGSQKFVPHFHVPLQSGSEKVLKDMRRRYTKDHYQTRIAKIKQLLPDACIGVDVIVGFPTETEADFLETHAFLSDLPISYLHVFTYSERDNTTAVRLGQTVDMAERKKRNHSLQMLSEKKKRLFYESMRQKRFTVLWEGEQDAETMQGFTENYLQVQAPFDAQKINTFEPVDLKFLDKENRFIVEPCQELL